MQGFETFMSSLKSKTFCPDKEGCGVDLVLSCVDNYEARMVVNQVRLAAMMAGFFIEPLVKPFLPTISFEDNNIKIDLQLGFSITIWFGINIISISYGYLIVIVIVQACNELNQTWMESGKQHNFHVWITISWIKFASQLCKKNHLHKNNSMEKV